MSLTVYLEEMVLTDVYASNITHNLTTMAKEAGIYQHLWRPEEIGIVKAEQLIEPLTEGLARLKENPQLFKGFNPENGWGEYHSLVEFVEKYLLSCVEHPNAAVNVSR